MPDHPSSLRPPLWGKLPVLGLLAILSPLLFAPPQAQAEECSADWSLKSSRLTPLYPDTHATYLVYHFIHDPGVALRFNGDFAHARFQNFTLYEDVNATMVDKIPDVQIVPDSGSQNPFLPGVDRSTDARAYSLWLGQEGSPVSEQRNALIVDGDDQILSVFMRVYLPDDGLDELGGVPAPTIEAFDAQTMEPTACPTTHKENGFTRTESISPVTSDETIRFFGTGGGSAYPSYDTHYVYAVLDMQYGEIAALTFQAPETTDTSAGDGSFSGEEEVRYWSLCLSWLESTLTATCEADYHIPLNRQGEARVIFAPPTLKNHLAARRHRYLLIPMFPGDRIPVLLYRQILINKDYADGINQIPPFDATLPAEEQSGDLFIGAFSPQGVMCSAEELRADGCGM